MKAKIVLLMSITTFLVGCGPDVLPEAAVSTTVAARTDGVNDLPCMVTTRAGVLDAITKFESACGISEYRDCAPISEGVYQCSNYKIDGTYVPPPNPAAIPPPSVIVEPSRSLQSPEMTRGPVKVVPKVEVEIEVEPQSSVIVAPMQPPTAYVPKVVVPVAQPEPLPEVIPEPVQLPEPEPEVVIEYTPPPIIIPVDEPIDVSDLTITERDSFCESDGFERTLARKVFTPTCAASGFNAVSCNVETQTWTCDNSTDIVTEQPIVVETVQAPKPVVRKAPVVKTTPIKKAPEIIRKAPTVHYDISNIPKPDLDIVVDNDDFSDSNIIEEGVRWVDVIKSGGSVWVSGFSSGVADVLEYVAFAYPNTNTKKVAVIANYSMRDLSTVPYAIIANYAVAIKVHSDDEIDEVIATNMNSNSPVLLELYPTGP